MQSIDENIVLYDRDLPMSLKYHATYDANIKTFNSCKLKFLYVVPHIGRKSDDKKSMISTVAWFL